jgi:hypothetical protein
MSTDPFASSIISVVLAWVFSIPLIVGLIVYLVDMLFKKQEELPRGFTIWLLICMVFLSPARYIILQVLMAIAFPFQSLSAFLSTFMLAFYIPIVFGLLYALGIGAPILLISLIAGMEKVESKKRLLLSCVAAPFVLLVFNYLFFFGLSYAAYSIHWLNANDVIGTTNGPSEYFFRYVCETGTPLELPKFLTDGVILERLHAKGRLRAHIAAVYLGKKQFEYYVETTFPEYLSQITGPKSEIQQKETPKKSSDYPDLTAMEISELSQIIAKLSEGPITDEDIGRFKQVNKDYFKRTGKTINEAQVKLLLHVNKTTSDYNHELGQCLLISYDTKEPFISTKLQSLRADMEKEGFVRKSKLDSDFRRVRSVAKREVFIDEFGDEQQPLTRDQIVNGIKSIDVLMENMDKLAKAISALTETDAQ